MTEEVRIERLRRQLATSLLEELEAMHWTKPPTLQLTVDDYSDFVRHDHPIIEKIAIYTDANWLATVWGAETPLAWLAFDNWPSEYPDAFVVTEIQGIKGNSLFPEAAEYLLRAFCEVALDYRSSLMVRPAQCLLGWKEPYLPDLDGEELRRERARIRTRIEYYHNAVPRQLGFRMASKRSVKRWIRYKQKWLDPPEYMPHHILSRKSTEEGVL